MTDAPILSVRNLATGYGDLRVVWDVSFDVHPGALTVLLGRNGAGKTTTLRAIAGLNRSPRAARYSTARTFSDARPQTG